MSFKISNNQKVRLAQTSQVPMWNANQLYNIPIFPPDLNPINNSSLIYEDGFWKMKAISNSTGNTGPTGPIGSNNYPAIMTLTGPMGPTGVVNTSIIPDTDSVYSLGMTGLRFDKLFLSGDTLFLGNTTLSSKTGIDTTEVFSVDTPFHTGKIFLSYSGSTGSATILQVNESGDLETIKIDSEGDLVNESKTGSTGPTGFKGGLGVLGSVGLGVSTGSTGPTGYIGPTGHLGKIGPTGIIGYTGKTGPTGFTGYTGPQGEVSETGATGFTGFTGYTGSDGLDAETGATGFTGFTGYTGPTGFTGSIGFTGCTGYTGYTGIRGYWYNRYYGLYW
jgi:hypothetical protein